MAVDIDGGNGIDVNHKKFELQLPCNHAFVTGINSRLEERTWATREKEPWYVQQRWTQQLTQW